MVNIWVGLQYWRRGSDKIGRLKNMWLMPRSTVLLQTLPAPQLVKKFIPFYKPQMFITKFTTAEHLSLSQAKWINSIMSYPISLTSTSIHPPIYIHVFPCGLFLSVFPTNMCQMPYLPHPPPFYHLNNIWWGAQTTKPFIMQFSPFPCYFLPFMAKTEHLFRSLYNSTKYEGWNYLFTTDTK